MTYAINKEKLWLWDSNPGLLDKNITVWKISGNFPENFLKYFGKLPKIFFFFGNNRNSKRDRLFKIHRNRTVEKGINNRRDIENGPILKDISTATQIYCSIMLCREMLMQYITNSISVRDI
jgi:hypothetical protein